MKIPKNIEISPRNAMRLQLQEQRDLAKRKRERSISKLIDWELINESWYIYELAEKTGLSIGQVNKAIESLDRKRNPRMAQKPSK